MTLRNGKAILLAAVAAGLFAAPAARAGLLPISVTQTPDSGDTRFTYGVMLTTDNTLKTGDYFTVVDFAGYVDGSAVMPSGWSVSMANLGPRPDKLSPTDDPATPDLTFTYSGPDLTGQIGLGNFSALSTAPNTATDDFVARSHRSVDGHIDSNVTDALVPAGSTGGTPPGVPEPATLALVGIGLPLVGGARLLRRKK